MVRGILVSVDDVESPSVSIHETDGELNSLYDILKCGTIDIVTRKIGDTYFDIVCDDEGLFKEHPIVSAIDKDGNPMLVGNLFICHHDNEGNLSSLTEEDYKTLRNGENVAFLYTEDAFYLGIIVSY